MRRLGSCALALALAAGLGMYTTDADAGGKGGQHADAGGKAGKAGKAAQDLVGELRTIAETYRAMFKSSNRSIYWNGWRYGWGDSAHSANDRQADKIDWLKGQADQLRKSHSYHDSILEYNDLLMATEVDGSKVGNCGDIATAVYAHIFNNLKGVDVALAGRQGGDHNFVWVKQPGSPDIYIVDGWHEDGVVAGPFRLEGGTLYHKGTDTPAGPPWEGPYVNLSDEEGKWVRSRGALGLSSPGQPSYAGEGARVHERVRTKRSPGTSKYTLKVRNAGSTSAPVKVAVYGAKKTATLATYSFSLAGGATREVDVDRLLRGCRIGATCKPGASVRGRYVKVCGDVPFEGVSATSPEPAAMSGYVDVPFAFIGDPSACD